MSCRASIGNRIMESYLQDCGASIFRPAILFRPDTSLRGERCIWSPWTVKKHMPLDDHRKHSTQKLWLKLVCSWASLISPRGAPKYWIELWWFLCKTSKAILRLTHFENPSDLALILLWPNKILLFLDKKKISERSCLRIKPSWSGMWQKNKKTSRWLAYLLTASIFGDQAPVDTGHPCDLWPSRIHSLPLRQLSEVIILCFVSILLTRCSVKLGLLIAPPLRKGCGLQASAGHRVRFL